MSAERCGESITFEDFQESARQIAERGMYIPPRIISYRAMKMLKRVQAKEPGWDNWQVSAEIWFKARSLGLLEEE